MTAGATHVNQRTALIIRFAGFLLPVILTFYGLLIQLGALASTYYSNDIAFYAIMIPWVALSVYQFFVDSRGRAESSLRLIAYHLFAALFVLLVSGFAMPFISTWMILFLASYAYFSHDGLRLSILAFFGTAVGDILLHIDDQQHITANVLAMLATFIIGIIAVSLSQAQEVDREELLRSQTEESLQRDRIMTIVNNLADAILSTDKNGVIRVYNAASLGLLDTNTSLEGKHIDDIIKLIDSNNKIIKLLPKLKATSVVQVREDLSASISGEQIHLSVVYSPIRGANSHQGNGHDGYIVILRDITKQKSLEEERDEFISVVSHELRTPITIAEGVVSNVQLMMDRSDIPKMTLQENLATAHEQVMFLARLVNDLSTLSRAERGVADTPETINVREMIHDLYNEYAPQARAKGLRLNLDLSPQLGEVVASRLYLKELLQNFVTNSIKYTKEGEVVIRTHKSNGEITFSIKDTGIGISKSDQAHIFEKFYRSEDYRTRETGGTGLGLYVAAKLAKKLGTHITMTSRLNHGSSFNFNLPSTNRSTLDTSAQHE
ncbi:PAS domain S-box protein [Candidatus Saccharibacteria bacterium]|nr:PAS domain S-box protein [Candidatus Saccharibacteria bacterium]